jgi:hypothetical protein
MEDEQELGGHDLFLYLHLGRRGVKKPLKQSSHDSWHGLQMNHGLP